MVLAIAALVFYLSPAQTLYQGDQGAGQGTATSAPALLAANLPDAAPKAASFSSVSTDSHSAQPAGAPAVKSALAGSSATSTASLDATLQNSPSLAMIRVPESESGPVRFISAELLPSRKAWIALSVAQHAAAAFDAYTTRYSISRGAVEQDPLMRPFADSSGIYAAIQVCPVALDFAARRMQRSQNNFIRRAWWVPQTVSTGMYLFSGTHNLHVANQR
jgi:hypothetical protein